MKTTICVVVALFGWRAEMVEYRLEWTGKVVDWKSKRGNWCKKHLSAPMTEETLQEWPLWESWEAILVEGFDSAPADVKLLVPVFSERLMPALNPPLMPRSYWGINASPALSFGTAARFFGHASGNKKEVVLGIDKERRKCFASLLLSSAESLHPKRETLWQERFPNDQICLVSESRTIQGSISGLGADSGYSVVPVMPGSHLPAGRLSSRVMDKEHLRRHSQAVCIGAATYGITTLVLPLLTGQMSLFPQMATWQVAESLPLFDTS